MPITEVFSHDLEAMIFGYLLDGFPASCPLEVSIGQAWLLT